MLTGLLSVHFSLIFSFDFCVVDLSWLLISFLLHVKSTYAAYPSI